MKKPGSILIIACGALAHEITTLKRLNGWNHVDLQCLRADLHNHPEKITGAVREQIEKARGRYDRIYIGYADCGTGGLLDAMLETEQIERLPGAHCYEFFATSRIFNDLSEAELVYLSQTQDGELVELARIAADRLGLEFEHRYTGYGDLERSLTRLATNIVATSEKP